MYWRTISEFLNSEIYMRKKEKNSESSKKEKTSGKMNDGHPVYSQTRNISLKTLIYSASMIIQMLL